MAFREVRIREVKNKLAFRFDPERDVVEIMLHGQCYEVALDDYRGPVHHRRISDTMGVDFRRIEGEERGR